MATIIDNVQQVRRRIAQACEMAQRPLDSVELVCVGKTRPAEQIRSAFEAGARHFGENYVQEGLAKIEALAELRDDIVWHLIGPLQSNKTKLVAAAFDWVESVDRLKIAERLSQHRPSDKPPLQVCLQVNISREASKAGVLPEEVAAVAAAVAELPRLTLRGLMAIPAPAQGLSAQREPHRQLRELMAALTGPGHRLGAAFDTLSMGMSDDLDAAVLEGATMVRVGTAIFGEREPVARAGGPSTLQS